MAQGHYMGRVHLDGFGNAATEDGRTLWTMVDLEGSDLRHLHKSRDADANAAQSVLAWNSYTAMRDALERAEWWISTIEGGSEMRDVCRAALMVARGGK